MPTNQLTDEELTKMLQESQIDDYQKEAIAPLIPDMLPEEKEELMGLIERSTQIEAQAQTEYAEKVQTLNEEYLGKMQEVVRTETANARQEFEQLDSKEAEKTMAALEHEISEM